MMNIELAEDLFYLGIEIPGVQFVQPYDGIGDPVYILFIAGSLIFLDGVDDGMIVMKDIVQDGFILYKDRLLLKEGNRNILMYPYRAAVRCVFPGKDPEQGGFPAAVAGDQGDLVAFLNMKCDILKQWLYAVRFAEIPDRNVVHLANIRQNQRQAMLLSVDRAPPVARIMLL